MSNVKFKWNPNWKRELAKEVAPALRELAAKRTRQYEDLVSQHRGGDIEAVKAELVTLYSADGGEIIDPELTQHAEAIVSGRRVTFET